MAETITYKPNTIEYKVIAKLQSEGLYLTSDWSLIETCLARTVSPTRCIEVARRLVEENQWPVNWNSTMEKPVRAGTSPFRLIRVSRLEERQELTWYNVETEEVTNDSEIKTPSPLTNFDKWDYV